MPLTSWPRPCPIGIFTGKFHIGRVYGKKTCGGRDCVREWRIWSSTMQQKFSHLADATIQERFELMQAEAELEALKAPEIIEEPTPEKPDTRPSFIREALNPANLFLKRKDEDGESKPLDANSPAPTTNK